MAKNKMNYTILAVYIAIMILITIFQLIAITLFPEILENDNLYVTFNSVVNLLLYTSLFTLFAVLFRSYLKKQLFDFNQHKLNFIGIIIIGFIIMMATSVLSGVILQFLGVDETSENQAALNMMLDGTLFDKIALFAFAVLLVPLVEELVFRKAIFDMFHFKFGEDDGSKKAKLLNITSTTIAVMISSFAFGFIHIMSFELEAFLQIIYYSGLGVVLGVLYLLSNKNILVPVTVHFLLNLMVTTILLLNS
ncbi:MAG: CPBP family intramembrane metalloprotease [Candidatus Izimaplasma sp.]|nr:CPBP family intramembrane metalloprotease [Candidatus Izimaplasma bacterium]